MSTLDLQAERQRAIVAEQALLAATQAAASVREALILPPGNMLQVQTPTAWFAANYFIASRFAVRTGGNYRYARFKIGVASGNIEAAVLKIGGTGLAPTYTRVMTSGQIACPAAGNIRLDLGSTLLTPGDYALAFWADNTTVTVPHSLEGGGVTIASGVAFTSSVAATPLAASGALSYTSRLMFGYALEADI